jgi:hypothetical protein
MSSEDNLQIDEIFHSDFLTDRTHQERLLLLVWCGIALLITRAGFIPTKITALGIDYNACHQQALRAVILSVLGYFLLAFVVHAIADTYRWKKNIQLAKQAGAKKGMAMQVDRVSKLQPGSSTPFDHLTPAQKKIEVERKKGFLRMYVEAEAGENASKFHIISVKQRVVFDLFFPVLFAFITAPLVWTAQLPPVSGC